jgi:exopolysaccharide biosynthesis WecB/TagA/CpsF family protein
MDSRSEIAGDIAGRVSAGLMLIIIAPVWVVRIGMTLVRGGRIEWITRYGHLGPFRALSVVDRDNRRRTCWLPNVVNGDLAFIGPEPAIAVSGKPARQPGLVRPSRVRRAVGIGHQADTDDDGAFYRTATLRQRAGLLLRFLLSGLMSATSAATATAEPVVDVFGVRINAITMRQAVDKVVGWSAHGNFPAMKLVSFVNPDCLNKAIENREYHYSVGRSDLVLPDGSGLRIAAKLLGLPLHDNVNGTDLFPLLCEAAAEKGQSLFFFGGLPGIAEKAAAAMQQQFPELTIAGCHDGYTNRDDNEAIVNAINDSGADILLVGLGAPSQEKWLLDQRDQLNAAVALGVGGLFDYYSGHIARAPLWLREAGLEWVWRILQEPAAKWRRYVVGNPLFLWRVFMEQRARRAGIEALRLQQALPDPSEFESLERVSSRQHRNRAWLATAFWQLGLSFRTFAKRALDVLVSASALICLSPLLIGTMLAIRIESPGPIFFKQVRVGARGKPFSMYKFRSMFIDAEERLLELQQQNESADGVLFKMKQDPRITRVGRLIRRFSIDELPQILNVLRGEMAIVGPRPALPGEVAQYDLTDRKRLQTKPGLTCLWQIGGRSDLSFEQQVSLDIEYLKRQDLLTDIRIIAGTVPAVISGKGAY